jgi:sterol desaturase/sphingolipid hydroxylase (fatty acid hydroxylase superfamily)
MRLSVQGFEMSSITNLWIWVWSVGLYWTVGAALMWAYRIPWPSRTVLESVWFNQLCVEPIVLMVLPPFPLRPWSFWDVRDLLLVLVWTEVTFYSVHRLLHHPWLFRWIHARHHTFTTPIPIIAVYAHPMEHLVLNLGTTLSGPVALRMHAWAVGAWVSVCVFTTLRAHLATHLATRSDLHVQHHKTPRRYYSVMGWMDTWCHTGLKTRSNE